MREREIINTFDQLRAAGGGVAISTAYLPGQSVHPYGWSVWRVNAKGKQVVTDPDAPWYAYGSRVFSFSGDKKAALEAAKAWAAEQFGEQGPWKRNRMHDYVPERIFKQFPIER